MAEKKYDLLLVTTESDKKKQNIPWYKERINLKYSKATGPGNPGKVNVGKDWVFVKDGLDDFRDGLPPITEGSVVIRNPNAGLGPALKSHNTGATPIKQSVNDGRYTKEEICFSKQTPLQRKQRQHISELEYGLVQHPLALYPHLEESVPPEVYDDIVDLLDPEMTLLETEGVDEATLLSADGQHQASTRHQEVQTSADSNGSGGATGERAKSSKSADGRHFYSWIKKREEAAATAAGRDADARPRQEPAKDPHIEKVTKDFCEWVASLGGEANNIEESTVMSLFASGYETKPALSVPIHVVELTSIPPELRQNIALPPQRHQDREEAEMEREYLRRLGKEAGDSTDPGWMKFRYGAWYLEPETWRKLPAGQLLEDPEERKDTKQLEARQRAQEMNETLSSLHGARSFIDFMKKKDTRKPEFLTQVEHIIARREAEEARRQELEALKLSQMAKRRQSAAATAGAPGGAAAPAEEKRSA
ncbi:hypothetical protein BOX15_Mlig005114g1 [Macrostomum lignano]|uniref:Uncharacterized protein n=1 Tax=Macrostomum lignano TaxID=282301 RepID=A0A267FC06_9PLAT|nr:hypothetical protein BOX15_Mlig005114g1 [Macrostomum lignano]